MPLWSIVFGVALIALGLEGYTNAIGLFDVKELHKFTSLIPAVVGVLLTQCGLAGLRPAWRKHAMHVAAMLALVGAVAGLGMGGRKLPELWQGTAERPAAVKLQLAMGVLCLLLLVLCIKSFIDARRRRQAAGLKASDL